jgi:hypothetical protein
MILTNYPFDRALVAERRRDPLGHPELIRRTRRGRGPRQTRPSRAKSRFASWLLGHAAQNRGAAGTSTAAIAHLSRGSEPTDGSIRR